MFGIKTGKRTVKKMLEYCKCKAYSVIEGKGWATQQDKAERL